MSLPTELSDYVDRPDAAYRYAVLREEKRDGGKLYDLELTSQVWQSIVWKHRLHLFVPDRTTFPEVALLGIGGDFGDSNYYNALGDLSTESGLICAFLFDVPNQPLFEGKVEDELIAYTLVQCLDTGKADWPLLLPMTKSAMRAIDTVQALLRETGHVAPERFVVSGMSKRGWTTWLSSVADSRVAGIIPMVYDNLNLFAQMPHQREVWTDYSEQIRDYTEYDLQARMSTPEGFRLAQIIDPYTYRERLTLPKLMMNGSNDRYWATDALNLYWDGLVGPKHILYIPNSGHGLNDPQRIWRTTLAFVHAVASDIPLPPLDLKFHESDSGLHLVLNTDASASAARVWLARSETLDFRSCVWESSPLALAAEGWTTTIPLPSDGCLAAFGEIDLTPVGVPAYSLSTQMRIVDRRATK
jgi:PhoPQ-activated pathogenicity-related protein